MNIFVFTTVSEHISHSVSLFVIDCFSVSLGQSLHKLFRGIPK